MTGRHRGPDPSGKGKRNLSVGEEEQVAEEILGRPATNADTAPNNTVSGHQIEYDLDASYEDQATNARESVKRTLRRESLPENEK